MRLVLVPPAARRRAISVGVLVLASVASAPAAAQGTAPGATEAMRRLSIFVGTWDVDDVYRSASGRESRETGTRTCSWVLGGAYVECVTRGRNQAGREREYRWLINHDPERNRYDIVSVFQNWTGKLHQTMRLDSAGTTFEIRAPSSTDDGVEQWTWARLVFDGPDRAVWTSWRNRETESPSTWTQSTRETWVRRR